MKKTIIILCLLLSFNALAEARTKNILVIGDSRTGGLYHPGYPPNGWRYVLCNAGNNGLYTYWNDARLPDVNDLIDDPVPELDCPDYGLGHNTDTIEYYRDCIDPEVNAAANPVDAVMICLLFNDGIAIPVSFADYSTAGYSNKLDYLVSLYVEFIVTKIHGTLGVPYKRIIIVFPWAASVDGKDRAGASFSFAGGVLGDGTTLPTVPSGTIFSATGFIPHSNTVLHYMEHRIRTLLPDCQYIDLRHDLIDEFGGTPDIFARKYLLDGLHAFERGAYEAGGDGPSCNDNYAGSICEDKYEIAMKYVLPKIIKILPP